MIKTEPPKTQWKSKKKKNEFFEKPSNEEEFEGQIIEDILEPYEHKKIKNPYVKPKPQDAQTIVYETKNEIDDFLKTASEFNKFNAAARKQKRDYYYDKLFDNITEKGDRRQIIDGVVKTEDIFNMATTYSFDDPFLLVHADVTNLEFLWKSVATPRYALLAVDRYSSKVYVYPMRTRKQILQKLNQFYDEIKNKRKKCCCKWAINSNR